MNVGGSSSGFRTETFFRRHPMAMRNIGRCVFDVDGLPPLWVAACNQMDEIWVPSSFNVETFAGSGVAREKLFAIPETLNADLYDLAITPLQIRGAHGFVFLSVLVWERRKGWDILVRAYVDEFAPDEPVTLALHVSPFPGKTVAEHRAELERFIRVDLGRDPARIPRIVFLDQYLGSAEMPRLYRSVDAYVTASRGEGWARPCMEAMAMGVPTLATAWSGMATYMSDENSYPVHCELVDVPQPVWLEKPEYRGFRCAQPSAEHLRRQMRRVFGQRAEAAQKGQKAREHVLANFGFDSTAERVIERLRTIGEPPLRKRTPRRAPPIAVDWEGPQFTHFGMAEVNRELCAELLKFEEVDLALLAPGPLEPDLAMAERYRRLVERVGVPTRRPVDVHVRHTWPINLSPALSGRCVVYQPWEFGSAPRAWVSEFNQIADEVWVPSSYVRNCYVRSGVEEGKIVVVPNAVAPDRFHPRTKPLDLPTKKGFRFLFVGGTLYRKGIDILLDTYVQSFGPDDDVCLVIKDLGADTFYRGQNYREQILLAQNDRSKPEIVYLGSDFRTDQMPSLYRACTCLVHPYRGEGFGLPIAEAMACGLPVIVPDRGACLDFCDRTTAFLVPSNEVRHREARVGMLETVDFPWFAEVDRRQLANAMRRVVEDPAAAHGVGERASRDIRTNLTWKRSAQIVLQRVRELARSVQDSRFKGQGPELPPTASEPQVYKVSQSRTATGKQRTTRGARPAARLSVCMVVRDEEEQLPRALSSVAPVADEIIVVDTGSRDGTMAVAEAAGARVFQHEWKDDFAEARNESLRHATNAWIMVIDADQALDEHSRDEVRRLIESNDLTGYLVRQLNYTYKGPAGSHVEHLTVRLFPNHPDIRYFGRVHEQVLASRADLPFVLRPCGVVLHHFGYEPDRYVERAKANRDRGILERAVREEPSSPLYAYYLGLTYLLLGIPARAESELVRALELCAECAAAGQPQTFHPATYVALARALSQQGRGQESIQCCREAVLLQPRLGDAQLTLGNIAVEVNDYHTAMNAFERALACGSEPALIPTDRSASTWKPLLGMAEVYARQERWAEAYDTLNQANAHDSKASSVLVALGIALLRLGRPDEALRPLSRASELQDAPLEVWMLLAGAYEKLDRLGEAEQAHLTGLGHRPNDAAHHAALGRLLARQGRREEALQWLAHAVQLDAQNPALLADLGRVLAEIGRRSDADQAFEAAIGLAIHSTAVDASGATSAASRQPSMTLGTGHANRQRVTV
jgi:glycosyltransferase involved in cell wall biosynthesis/tetratricopeptide (TPR) repeat protein